MSCAAIVMGGSAGGYTALATILAALPGNFAPPVLVVQHLHSSDDGSFAQNLAGTARVPVIEPCDKERIEGGRIYTAPANYHMLIERGGTISLSVDERVNWSRPSIDVLFESAARVWGADLIAVILSGASADGTNGLRAVKAAGGRTIAQDPASAETPFMPRMAIDSRVVDEALSPEGIANRLVELSNANGRSPIPNRYQAHHARD